MSSEGRPGLTGGIFPPPLIPILGIVVAGGLHVLFDLPAGPLGVRIVGGATVVVAVGLWVWAIRTMLREGAHPDVRRPTEHLVTDGPFAMSRNPVYLAFLLFQAGVSLAAGWWTGALLVPVSAFAFTRLIILDEEAELRASFDGFQAYAEDVRRWL